MDTASKIIALICVFGAASGVWLGADNAWFGLATFNALLALILAGDN